MVVGAGLGAAGSRGVSPACAASCLLCCECRGFDVDVLSLSLSLEPCEYLSILGLSLK